MKKIPLTQGKFALVDDADFEWLNQWKWLCMSNGYAARFDYSGEGRTLVSMHRLIMKPENGMLVDHINGDRLDNRRENLRVTNQTVNHINSKVRSSTGFKGVTLLGNGKFLAQLKFKGRNYNLGCYETPQEANEAYRKATYVRAQV